MAVTIASLPLAVDTDTFRPGDKIRARDELGLEPDRFILLSLGLTSPLKGDLLPLLFTVRRLIQTGCLHRLLLIIAGTVTKVYKEEILAHSRELGIAENVIVFGAITDAVRIKLLQSADIFVSLSDSPQESFGLAPVEAMACGVPQVVSAWDGYRETVRHGETGFLIPTYWARCDQDLGFTGVLLGWPYEHLVLGQSVAVDYEQLYASCSELIKNEHLRRCMSEVSRQVAVRDFRLSVMASRYYDLWQEQVESSRYIASAARVDLTTPRYYDVFGRYASRTLEPDQELTLGHNAHEDVALLSRRTSVELGFSGINSTLAAALLKAVACHKCIRVKELVDMNVAIGAGEALVLRHILWLLKYGALALGPRVGAEQGRD